jgi:hypothetical protein
VRDSGAAASAVYGGCGEDDLLAVHNSWRSRATRRMLTIKKGAGLLLVVE